VLYFTNNIEGYPFNVLKLLLGSVFCYLSLSTYVLSLQEYVKSSSGAKNNISAKWEPSSIHSFSLESIVIQFTLHIGALFTVYRVNIGGAGICPGPPEWVGVYFIV
jgi:hypothetical protein